MMKTKTVVVSSIAAAFLFTSSALADGAQEEARGEAKTEAAQSEAAAGHPHKAKKLAKQGAKEESKGAKEEARGQ
jgi:hypothetical protein